MKKTTKGAYALFVSWYQVKKTKTTKGAYALFVSIFQRHFLNVRGLRETTALFNYRSCWTSNDLLIGTISIFCAFYSLSGTNELKILGAKALNVSILAVHFYLRSPCCKAINYWKTWHLIHTAIFLSPQ